MSSENFWLDMGIPNGLKNSYALTLLKNIGLIEGNSKISVLKDIKPKEMRGRVCAFFYQFSKSIDTISTALKTLVSNGDLWGGVGEYGFTYGVEGAVMYSKKNDKLYIYPFLFAVADDHDNGSSEYNYQIVTTTTEDVDDSSSIPLSDAATERAGTMELLSHLDLNLGPRAPWGVIQYFHNLNIVFFKKYMNCEIRVDGMHVELLHF